MDTAILTGQLYDSKILRLQVCYRAAKSPTYLLEGSKKVERNIKINFHVR